MFFFTVICRTEQKKMWITANCSLLTDTVNLQLYESCLDIPYNFIVAYKCSYLVTIKKLTLALRLHWKACEQVNKW